MADRKILIIEDNPLNLKLVRSLVQLGGYEPVEAMDAESGIRLAGETSPDLILMDIQLPGMDGLTATRQLKRDPRLGHIPVVALTSCAMSGDEEKAIGAGCSGYITKPVDTRQFLAKINAYLPGAGETAPLSPGRPATAPQCGAPSKPVVLVVDDEPKNVKLLAALLPAGQFDVRRAHGGREGLEKARASLPDLILLDLMMPDVDGYQVTRELKTDPKTQHIPVVLVTALDGSESRRTGMECGADEYLTKPVNGVELLARVRSMLKIGQYREQLTIRTRSETAFPEGAGDHRLVTGDTHTPRVLLLDDDRRDLDLVRNCLRDLSCEIVTAGNGLEAIHYARRTPVDLMLLDVVLPGIDGFEVCRRLKAMEETQNIQLIMVTSLKSLESKIKGIEHGVDDFLVKPINPRELRARVVALLKKKRYLDQLRRHYEIALNSAITDGLTGLYNHAYFMRFLDLEVKRCARRSHSTALMMIDIDDFKTCNDTLGHLAGDVILRELSRLLLDNIRDIDLAARYGGEEFAVVLPYADRAGALSVADRMLERIRAHRFPDEFGALPGPVTASIGVALCPRDSRDTIGLIRKADAMLYRAKNSGKNRSCTFEDAAPDVPPARIGAGG